MPYGWPTLFGYVPSEPKRKIGHPKRDRAKVKAGRKAARGSR